MKEDVVERGVVKVHKRLLAALAAGLLKGFGYNPVEKKGVLYMNPLEHASAMALLRRFRSSAPRTRKNALLSPPEKYCTWCGKLYIRERENGVWWSKRRRCDACMKLKRPKETGTRYCMLCGEWFSVIGLPAANRALCPPCQEKRKQREK